MWEPSVVPALRKVFHRIASPIRQMPSGLSLPSRITSTEILAPSLSSSISSKPFNAFKRHFYLLCSICPTQPQSDHPFHTIARNTVHLPSLSYWHLALLSLLVKSKSQPTKLFKEQGDNPCYMTGRLAVPKSLPNPNLDAQQSRRSRACRDLAPPTLSYAQEFQEVGRFSD